MLVAHDTRFLGARLAEAASNALEACGVRVVPLRSPLPTPVAAHAVRRRRADAALIVTASHNAPEFQGLKLLTRQGAAAPASVTRRVERLAAEALVGVPPPATRRDSPRRRAVDALPAYLDALGRIVDPGPVRRARVGVVYDALHGAGAGVLDVALGRLGARVAVLRADPDPRFGGGAPDPVPERLGELRRRVRAGRGVRLGVATDGDADRFAVVDADGRLLSETQALALLLDHLARTGRVRRGVALSIATGSLVERVAEAHGLPVLRLPIGFKHLAAALQEGRADVAGEESGGFALAALGHDKDGILAACLVTELAARLRRPLRERLGELERRHGRSRCGRAAVPADEATSARLASLQRTPPARIDGARVRRVERLDGLRLGFDDGFLMLRASGTEPVARVYAEAPHARALARRLQVGRRLLGARRVDVSHRSG